MRSIIITGVFGFMLSVMAAEPPQSADQALESFRRTWNESLAKKLEVNLYVTLLQHQIFEAGRVGALSSSSGAVLKRVASTLTEGEKKQNIVVGTLKDLEPDRPVWTITNPGDYGSGFEATLDQSTGKLLFLWIIPEG